MRLKIISITVSLLCIILLWLMPDILRLSAGAAFFGSIIFRGAAIFGAIVLGICIIGSGLLSSGRNR